VTILADAKEVVKKKLYVLKEERWKRMGTRLAPPLRDLQRARPAAWCRRCRGELYRGEGPLCPGCQREKEEEEE